jgi:hypothetical protein
MNTEMIISPSGEQSQSPAHTQTEKEQKSNFVTYPDRSFPWLEDIKGDG